MKSRIAVFLGLVLAMAILGQAAVDTSKRTCEGPTQTIVDGEEPKSANCEMNLYAGETYTIKCHTDYSVLTGTNASEEICVPTSSITLGDSEYGPICDGDGTYKTVTQAFTGATVNTDKDSASGTDGLEFEMPATVSTEVTGHILCTHGGGTPDGRYFVSLHEKTETAPSSAFAPSFVSFFMFVSSLVVASVALF